MSSITLNAECHIFIITQSVVTPLSFAFISDCSTLTVGWACIIKLKTAAIYGFRNKLECLSLASLSGLV